MKTQGELSGEVRIHRTNPHGAEGLGLELARGDSMSDGEQVVGWSSGPARI